jgi:3-deoxy-D-manno-octulosonic-acid transferase
VYFSLKEKTLKLLYNILVYVAAFHIKIIAHFNSKLNLGVKGRAKTFDKLNTAIAPQDKVIWFHCASLGEYEQGLPVFEKIKEQYSKHKIVLSFFSPSGYEVRKNASIADIVIYLPLDTSKNANRFLNLVHPDLVVFVKYEFWPNYLNALKNRGITSILISALFRKDQSFFKFYGKWMQKHLHAFQHIFVQNTTSKKLLNSINYNNVTVSGDTRFDRVSNQLQTDNTLAFIEQFKQDKLCVIAGSTWTEDEQLLINFINKASNTVKFIIAPHNIKSQDIIRLKTKIKKETVLFSEKDTKNLAQSQVFIIDTIGLLSKVYSYADIAYVGGAIGTTGLHNILEPAVFGVPIIIGNNYSNFPEAFDMIALGGLFSISNQTALDTILNSLITNRNKRFESGKINAEYIYKNKGAVTQITAYLLNKQ